MKLQLRSSSETFDVPRNLGIALIVIGNGQIIEPPPPAPRVLSPNSKWTISELLDGTPLLAVTCLNCKRSATGYGPTVGRTLKFTHCGVTEYPPAEIDKAYSAAYRRAHGERPAHRAPGTVSVI